MIISSIFVLLVFQAVGMLRLASRSESVRNPGSWHYRQQNDQMIVDQMIFRFNLEPRRARQLLSNSNAAMMAALEFDTELRGEAATDELQAWLAVVRRRPRGILRQQDVMEAKDELASQGHAEPRTKVLRQEGTPGGVKDKSARQARL